MKRATGSSGIQHFEAQKTRYLVFCSQVWGASRLRAGVAAAS